jgi:hypothetical protein
MSLKYTICGMVWESLPPDAQQVGSPRGNSRLFLIDGIPHDVVSTKLGRKKAHHAKQEKHDNEV